MELVQAPKDFSAEPYQVGPITLHLRTAINFEIAEWLTSSDIWEPASFAWAMQRLKDRGAGPAGTGSYDLMRSPPQQVTRRPMGSRSTFGQERSVHLIWWSDVVTVGRKERHDS